MVKFSVASGILDKTQVYMKKGWRSGGPLSEQSYLVGHGEECEVCEILPVLKGDVSLGGADVSGGGGVQHPGHRHFSEQAPFPHQWERSCRTCRGSSYNLPNFLPSPDHQKLFKLVLLGCSQPCRHHGDPPSCGGLALPRT